MPEWLDALEDDDLKTNDSLSKFEDVGALAKSFLETKSMVGNSIRIPSEEASDEQRQEFYRKVAEKAPGVMLRPNLEDDEQRKEFFKSLGVPDDPSKYESVALDEGKIKFGEEKEGVYRKLAHEVGLTPAQFKQMMSGMLEADKAGLLANEEQNMEQMRALKQEWGMAFDDMKKIANKVRETFFDFIPEGQMDARTLKAMNVIGKQLLEGDAGLGDFRHDHDDNVMTPAEAQSQIDEIMNNNDHAYWNPSNPGHADALNKMVELQTAANPGISTELQRAGFGGG